MKNFIFLCLVSLVLTSEACSMRSDETNVPRANSEQLDRDKLNRTTGIRTETDAPPHATAQIDKSVIKNTKGLIVLSGRYGKSDYIRFYNEDGTLWYEFTFYYATAGGKFESNEDFLPFAFHPDYFSLALKCTGEDKNRYEVIVNEETELKKFVRKDDPTLKFETWDEHVTKAFAVDFNQAENPLRESPDGKAKNVDLPKELTFHPVEVKGEWLKVRWDGLQQPKKDAGLGWVKWRDNDHILVELFYFA